MADLIQEVPDHLHAVFGVVHLGMVLHTIEAPALIADCNVGASIGMGHQGEALGHLCHIIAVAHPGNALLGQALEQLAAGIIIGLGLAVLPGRILLGCCHLSAQGVGHQLAAIADAKDRHAQLKDLGIVMGRILLINAAGAAGEDDADGVHGLQLFKGGGIGLYLAVDIAFPDAAGNQLIILTAKVQDNDHLMIHIVISPFG